MTTISIPGQPYDPELIFEPTLRFRWFVDIHGEKNLQQKFCCINNEKYYWVNVETAFHNDIICEIEKGNKE